MWITTNVCTPRYIRKRGGIFASKLHTRGNSSLMWFLKLLNFNCSLVSDLADVEHKKKKCQWNALSHILIVPLWDEESNSNITRNEMGGKGSILADFVSPSGAKYRENLSRASGAQGANEQTHLDPQSTSALYYLFFYRPKFNPVV